MKRPFLAAIACSASVLFLLPHTASSQDATSTQLHVPVPLATGIMNMRADSVIREDSPNGGFASEVQLKGNVEIRMCCVQRNAAGGKSEVILQADQADYNGNTGEIEARGAMKVILRQAQ